MKYWGMLRRFKPLRTAAQSALALIATNGIGLTEVDWVGVGSVSGLAALVTVLTCVADGSTFLSESSTPEEEK